ncbi:o-spanin [Pseudomonas phage Eir4]|nr:o-spanin [Pseudomonas phage Eir4]
MKPLKEPSQKSRRTGRTTLPRLKALLLGLLLTCVAVMSGCQSNSQMPPSVASQVTVDPSLMVEPNYEQTLLNFLSDKPKEQTAK